MEGGELVRWEEWNGMGMGMGCVVVFEFLLLLRSCCLWFAVD